MTGWLAIIDPAGAAELNPLQSSSQFAVYQAESCQLLTDSAAGQVILFEGYLVDRARLSADLDVEQGAEFEARLIAAAYQRWGEALFEHVDGAFCAVIWDQHTGMLTAGHDGLGKHPLYYAQIGSQLRISSDLFAVAQYPGTPRNPNRVLLALRLMGIWSPAQQTPFMDISRLNPGCFLSFAPHSGRLHLRQFWFPIPDDEEEYLPHEEALARFEPEFEQAVARCMEHQPTGIMFSGGIDSVSVAVMASRYLAAHNLPPLTAYSGRISSRKVISYEEEMQDKVVQALSMPHLTRGDDELLQGMGMVGDSARFGIIFPYPLSMWWGAGFAQHYQGVANQGFQRLLTGSGGDEWLGVHHAYAADMLRGMNITSLWSILFATADTGGTGWKKAFQEVLWQNGIGSLLRSLWMKYKPQGRENHLRQRLAASIPAWLLPDSALREEVIETRVALRAPDLISQKRLPVSYYRHALRAIFANAALASQFETDFAFNRYVGIQRFSPFHDTCLVTFLNRISPQTLLIGNRYKGLLRPLAAKYLPGLHLEKQRKLYPANQESPMEQALIDSFLPAWEQIGAAHAADLGLVDLKALQATMSILSATVDARARLSMVLFVETWLMTHMHS